MSEEANGASATAERGAEQGPGIVVKQTEQDLADMVCDEAGFITAYCTLDQDPITLEPYQVAFLRDRSQFRWVTKSRQVGFSFILALEAMVRCQLRENYTAVFVSYSHADAKEKVQLARQVYDELPPGMRKRLITDSKSELEFESNSSRKSVSRIVSVPSKAPRGKHGDVILDELAHINNDREVFTGSTPLVLRGNSQLTGCSTPLGRRGVFWEVATQEIRRYPNYSRRVVPWWFCSAFCTDPSAAAQAVDDKVSTEELVRRFGVPLIVHQFESLGSEDFLQEFCAQFVDEAYSFFPHALIESCTSDDLELAHDFSDVPPPTGRLVAGFDVGRTRDRSELALFEQQENKLICRMLHSYKDTPFADQEGDLRRMLQVLPIARLSIDRSGLGMHLCENLSREFPQVVGENFTNELKEQWATNFKGLLQRRDVVLPKDRDLVAQIHSIRKRVLSSGRVAFEAERTTQQGHADRFWATALACKAESGATQSNVSLVTARIIGTREENEAEARREAGLEPVKRHWLLPPEDYDGDKQIWTPVGAINLSPHDLFRRR